MKKLFIILFCLFQFIGFSQKETAEIFNRISENMNTFTIDTSAVPNDNLSKKIRELRNLKGGFNVNEAMEYKIAEAHSKKEISDAEFVNIKNFLVNGNGKKWLDNAVIWIYRKKFTVNEIKVVIKFYKTSAGKKMANDFPIIMAQSVKAAEMILGKYKENK